MYRIRMPLNSFVTAGTNPQIRGAASWQVWVITQSDVRFATLFASRDSRELPFRYALLYEFL